MAASHFWEAATGKDGAGRQMIRVRMFWWMLGFVALVLAGLSYARPDVHITQACKFSSETGIPQFAEGTTRYTLTCRIDAPVETVWKALLDFEHLVQRAYRPMDLEFSRFITTEERRSEVIDRLRSLLLPKKPDLERLNEVPLSPPLVYEEQNLTQVFASWSVMRFIPDQTRAASGIYTLRFAKVDNLSSEETLEGQFTLQEDGKGSRLTYVLVQSPHVKLAGEGIIGFVNRVMLGKMYVNGVETFMTQRVQGIVQLAKHLGGTGNDRSR